MCTNISAKLYIQKMKISRYLQLYKIESLYKQGRHILKKAEIVNKLSNQDKN